jgi:mycothiol system anti-sigma-R factor
VLAMVYAYLDRDIRDEDLTGIRQHLDECGPCLREYGLEEAVKRLVHKTVGDSDPNATELRVRVSARILETRRKLDS